MGYQPKTHINAAVIAGVIGLIWLSAIWVNLVIPPTETPAGSEEAPILRGERIEINMHEWGFNQLKKGGPTIEIKAGQEVEIILTNNGKNFHSFQIRTKDGKPVAGLTKDDTIDPGATRTIKIRIDQPGEYIYVCPVSGHPEKGMRGTLIVTE